MIKYKVNTFRDGIAEVDTGDEIMEDFNPAQLQNVVDILNSQCEDIQAKDKQLAELKKQLEEKEKDNQFLKKMYLSERTKNDNYHTEKFGLDKPVEELRKIKLNPKEKEIYYKGFDNCERQFATHIAELQQQLKSLPAEIIDEIKKQMDARKLEYKTMENSFHIRGLMIDRIFENLDEILKEYQK